MSHLKATLCVNFRARQTDEQKLADIEEILQSKGVAYNKINPLALKKTSAKDLAPLLIAVGGDGTVNLVASAALQHKKTLAVIPLGTFNHFAKDLGVPLELDKATKTALAGKERLVDVGQVNDQLFLNNSAIGFYPHLVAKRQSWQGKIGKWLALVIASCTAVLKIKPYRLQLSIDGKVIHVKTRLLIVANNKYDLNNFGLAKRNKLDAGRLYVYVIKPHHLRGLVSVSLRLLFGKVTNDDFDCYDAQTIQIMNKKARLYVGIDGESLHLKTPLTYTALPRSLAIIT
jgi:YegS/Rv2252/BmrU family lipid kinase